MGLALDTIGFTRTGAAGGDLTPQASTVAAGDSFTIRSFSAPAVARLEGLLFQGDVKDTVRVRSPLLHDNVEGIQFLPGETPAAHQFPADFGQTLQSQDTLVAEQQVVTAAHVDVAALRIYYANLGGAAARLHAVSDFASIIRNIKVLRVLMPAGGAASVWLDALLTTTENLLHANTDYAVLGYITDTALCAVGLKGIDTGNLRVCGPGVLRTDATSNFFAEESVRQGGPRVPVFNSANAGATFISALGNVTPTGANIQLICAELANTLPA